jgi:hypothetical protein
MISILGMDIGALIEQQLRHFLVTFYRSSLEGIAELSTLGMDIRALVEQQLRDWH